MTPQNIDALLAVLRQIAESLTIANKYTITGAADWPILAAVGGLLIAILGFMWRDLRSAMKDLKRESRADIDTVWAAMRDCQHDCCPRKKE
ncbi:MAG TPA: hypothetical protein VKA08_16435 [Balneolales bacterium]|nr:hypothetical protein [Balneolales bacterium]